jgi:hypothetical protein
VVDRPLHVAVLLQPSARPLVHIRFALGLVAPKLGPKHVGEEGVVAEALLGAVQWSEQDVLAGELAQDAAGPVLLEHGVAERAG